MPLFETIYHTYKHKWTDISLASWRKYPSPDRPDVLSVDLLEKYLDPETGILHCKRLMICKDNTPAWLKAILGSTEYFFVEETIVDPRTQTMILKTKNLNFANILGVEEVCTYTPDPLNPEFTLFKQEATVSASIFGVARKVEKFCLDQFKVNSLRGRKIMEQAIEKVKREAEESLKEIEESFKEIEHKVDNVITTVKLEAEESLKEIEESIKEFEHQVDNVITTVKLETQESIANLDEMLTCVKQEVTNVHNFTRDDKIIIFNRAFKSSRFETLEHLGELFPTIYK